MEKQVIGTRVVLRLKASATNILLEDIADQIFFPLMREISEKLSRYGLNFSLMFYLQHQWDVLRDVDFRFHLLSGLIPEPPWDKKDCSHIRRALAAAIESTLEPRRESILHLTGQELAVAEHSLATGERRLVELQMPTDANGSAVPLAESDMHAYIYMALPSRIRQMLNADIAIGKLVVSVVDGKKVVLLDDLVLWADYREITPDQPPLPGCEHSHVDASYQRLNQQWSSVTQNSQSNEAKNVAVPQVDLAAKHTSTMPLGGVPPVSPAATPVPIKDKPWLIKDSRDPEPEDFQPWYTPARYFARKLIEDDSTLLVKRDVLAQKVSVSLAGVGVYKRGKKKQALDPVTIKKAFSNVNFS